MTVLQGLQTRLTRAKLYVFADSRRVHQLDDFVTDAVAGGADLVQVRLHGWTHARRAELLAGVRERCAGSQAIVVVDSDLAVATAAQADALVVDPEGLADARGKVAQYTLLGARAKTAGELQAAIAGADFALVHPALRGAEPTSVLSEAVRVAPPGDPHALRWFADGGVSPATVHTVLAAGARRIGVGTALWTARDVEATARQLADAVAAAWANDPAMAALTEAGSAQPRATLKDTSELAAEGLLPRDPHPVANPTGTEGPTSASEPRA